MSVKTTSNLPMLTRSSTFSSLRMVTVLVMAMAWLVATNHCALPLLAGEETGSQESECVACSHEKEKSNPSTGSDGLGCCKVFKSIAEKSISPVSQPVATDKLIYPSTALLVSPDIRQFFAANPNHGPPIEADFLRLIFERCHPAIAPPLV